MLPNDRERFGSDCARNSRCAASQSSSLAAMEFGFDCTRDEATAAARTFVCASVGTRFVAVAWSRVSARRVCSDSH